MGNLPNRDTDASRLLSGMLGVSWEDGTSTGYGPFVPDILRPNTYGFGVSDVIAPSLFIGATQLTSLPQTRPRE
jgi:hypothetical protein